MMCARKKENAEVEDSSEAIAYDDRIRPGSRDAKRQMSKLDFLNSNQHLNFFTFGLFDFVPIGFP